MSGRCCHHHIVNVDFKAIKIDYKFFCPQCRKVVWLFFEKPLKISFFAWGLYLGKNGRFDLLGWLNECWDPFLIVIILMWTSTSRQWKSLFNCFWLFSEVFFPVVFNHETPFFKTEWFDVWCPRLCHNDSGVFWACFLQISVLRIAFFQILLHFCSFNLLHNEI